MADPSDLLDNLALVHDVISSASGRFDVERTGGRQSIPPEVRRVILMRDKFRCDWCGQGGPGFPFQLDHIVPWSAGGSDDSTNLRLLCPGCNEDRSNYRTDAPVVRRRPCTIACMECTGWAEYEGVSWHDFADDERARAFCGGCNRESWVAFPPHYRTALV